MTNQIWSEYSAPPNWVSCRWQSALERWRLGFSHFFCYYRSSVYWSVRIFYRIRSSSQIKSQTMAWACSAEIANKYLPVCVRMCRFNRLGRSKALPHTSHGNRARSPRVGRAFGEDRGIVIELSIRSPALLAADDDVDDSPDTDLCSSSPADVGDMGNKTRDKSDIDRSNGDSGTEQKTNQNKENGIKQIFEDDLLTCWILKRILCDASLAYNERNLLQFFRENHI